MRRRGIRPGVRRACSATHDHPVGPQVRQVAHADRIAVGGTAGDRRGAQVLTQGRQLENIDLFDFELDAGDLTDLEELDRGEGAARNSDIEEEF